MQSTTLSNALAESLFATVECELLQRVRLTNREEAKTEIFRFLEGFYNRRRRHSALGYVAPVEFERSWSEARVARGLALRMDHGSQYLSDHFLNQLRYWGIHPSFAFVEEPETNGVVERAYSYEFER